MLCSIYQWLISSALDGDKPLGRLTRRHIARCHGCRAFWEGGIRLEDRLRADAPLAGASLLAAGHAPGRRPLLLRPAFWVPLAAAAAVIIGVAVFIATRAQEAAPPVPRRPIARRPRPAPPAVPAALRADRLVVSLHGAGTAMMEAEIDHLADDARAAAGTLAAYLSVDPASRTRPQRQ